MESLKFFKINIKYEGTFYLGWQIQPQSPTVQETIEKTLFKLTGEKVRIIAAGRTDQGVHALGQVAHFKLKTRLDEYALIKGLNSLLPDDIVINSLSQCPPDFHSRYSATAKHYLYMLQQGPNQLILTKNFCDYVRTPLAIDKMREASKYFIGTHNFKDFCANSGKDIENFERTIFDLRIDSHPPFIFFHVLGKSFLYKMVRLITGTLIKAGLGKISPETVGKIFSQPEKYAHFARHAAPAKGLTLAEVFYDNNPKIPPPDEICNFFDLSFVLNSRKILY